LKAHLAATGYWEISGTDTKYHGDLYLNEKEGAIFLYIRVPNNGSPGSYLKVPLEIDYIDGTAINGAKMTLLDCSRISMKSQVGVEDVYGYQAKFMLENISFEKKEDIVFSRLQIQMPGIIKWGAKSNYGIPEKGKYESVINFQEIEPVSIHSDKKYDLSYSLIPRLPFFDFMKEEIKLKQFPYLIIESKKAQSLEWFLEIASKMKNMIEIAMGTPLAFGKMIAESPSVTWNIEGEVERKKAIEIMHFLLSDNENEDKENQENNFLFNLLELHENGDFSRWQNVSALMEPIIELYIDDLYNKNLSISRHFLNMIQALETYHSRMICNGNLNDYKRRVEEVISIRPNGFKPGDREFLIGKSQKFITLGNRVSDLLVADFKIHFYTGDIKFLNFPKVISDTRNYYTHYNPKLEGKALKDDKLVTVYYILRNMLEYYLLRELGFNEEFIGNRINDRIKPIKISNDIKRTEENRKKEIGKKS
jgi:hypothetical protein